MRRTEERSLEKLRKNLNTEKRHGMWKLYAKRKK